MLSGPFVALVLESERRVTGCGALDFRKATKIALVPLFATGRTLTAQQQKDEDRYLDLLRGAFAAVSFRRVALPHCPQCEASPQPPLLLLLCILLLCILLDVFYYIHLSFIGDAQLYLLCSIATEQISDLFGN